MKRRLLIFIAVLLLAILPMSVFAANQNLPRVIDDAEIFTPSQELDLTSRIWDFVHNTGFDFVLYTDVTTDGRMVETYAENYYELNGYDWDGMILFICMEEGNRCWYSAAFGKCADLYTAKLGNYADDKMMPFMSAGNYADGVMTFIDTVEKGFEPEEETPPPLGMLGGIAAAIGLIPASASRAKARSGMKIEGKRNAGAYAIRNSLTVRNKSVNFLYSETEKIPKQKEKSEHTEHTSAVRGNQVSGSKRNF